MKQAIFNSLGSNYSWGFRLKSAFGGGSAKDQAKFAVTLGKYYQGNATLTYKGREALELALKISDLPEDSAVGIAGFTCYVVYRAIENAGYKPVFVDVAPQQVHFGLDELKAAHAKHKNLSAIIIQNTLGYPADIQAIQPYCKKHNIVIIEDGAHSLGAVYGNGQEVGTVGELVMFSFSQDKPLDVVAGGALIYRRPAAKTQPQTSLKSASWWQREINRDYPFWTGLIRFSYSVGLGRLLHFALKKINFLATPMKDAGPGLHKMDNKTASLLLSRWAGRQSELEHRQAIAAIYEKSLPKELQLIEQLLGKPSYLRFPLILDNRDQLIKYLKENHIYIGDTWYDTPIAPQRYLSRTNYKTGTCPRAEGLCNRIVNLPTHINISQEQAEFIAGKVKQWHKSQ